MKRSLAASLGVRRTARTPTWMVHGPTKGMRKTGWHTTCPECNSRVPWGSEAKREPTARVEVVIQMDKWDFFEGENKKNIDETHGPEKLDYLGEKKSGNFIEF